MIWHLLGEMILAGISSVCFGILRSTPWKAAIPVAIIGGLDWVFYVVLYYQWHWGLGISNMLAAMFISIASFFTARWMKMPMIAFNMPALAALVPGGQAYKVVRYFVLGNYDSSLFFLYQIFIICGAITLGFGLGDVINRAMFFSISRRKKRAQLRETK